MAPGIKTGGRTKGTPNKFTRDHQIAVAKSGLSPIDYMLSVMRDEGKEDSIRIDAAKSVAPYLHAKLSSVVLAGDADNPINVRNIVLTALTPKADAE